MIQFLLLLLITFFTIVLAQGPQIRIHRGFISVHDAVYGGSSTGGPYSIGHPYTFELFLDNTHTQDYVIEKCTMNGVQFIGPHGCVQCSNNVIQSVETEQYNVPGAMKRTLVHFNAPANQIVFDCVVDVYQCCGCAERSCERRPVLLGLVPQVVPVHCGAAIGAGAVGGYAAPAGAGGYAVGTTHGIFWPWWLWLLLGLLLLLLLLCCIACCLAAFSKKKSKKTTVTRVATAAEAKGVGVCIGTEKQSVHEIGVGTNGSLCNPNHDVERITPAIAVLDVNMKESRSASRSDMNYRDERTLHGYSNEHMHERNGHTNDLHENSGAYSVREAKLTNERIARHDRPRPAMLPPHTTAGFHDRSSYRNFAYERDRGRVEPMSGFDEVETTERRYCLSDDECDIVEKDIKRTHTTRFTQESRHIEADSDSGSERFREEGVHHAVYAQSLPV